jgi:hypothetical protein
VQWPVILGGLRYTKGGGNHPATPPSAYVGIFRDPVGLLLSEDGEKSNPGGARAQVGINGKNRRAVEVLVDRNGVALHPDALGDRLAIAIGAR